MTIYAVLFLQQLIASSTHLIAKNVTAGLHPASVVLVRGIWTCLAFAVWFTIRPRTWKTVDRRDIIAILLLGLVNIPVNQMLFIWGVSYTTAPNASLAYALTPAFIVALQVGVHRLPAGPGKLLGVAIALVGAAVVLVDRGAGISAGQMTGNVMVLLASLSWACFTLYGRRLVKRYGPVQAIAMTFFAGLAIYAPVWAILPVDAPLDPLWSPGSTHIWGQLFYLGVVTSGIGYGLWYYSLSRLESSKVAVFNNLQPVITSVLTFLLIGATPSPLFIIGGAITLVGVIITQRS